MENASVRQINDYVKSAMDKGFPPFVPLGEEIPIPPKRDAFTGHPAPGPEFFKLYYDNRQNGVTKTDYARVGDVADQKPHWLPGSHAKGVATEDYSPDKTAKVSFKVPVTDLNQDVIKDSFSRRPGYVPFINHSSDYRDTKGFLVEEFSNIINASLSGVPYASKLNPKELQSLSDSLTYEMTQNPRFISACMKQAQENVVTYSYHPYNTDDFVQKARVENSPEFQTLNSQITRHVSDCYLHDQKSFNPEFDKMAQPLYGKLDGYGIDKKNTQEAEAFEKTIAKETKEFNKEHVKNDKDSKTLMATFFGTIAKEAKNFAKKYGTLIAATIVIGSYLLPALPKAEAAPAAPSKTSYEYVIPLASYAASPYLSQMNGGQPQISPEEFKMIEASRQTNQFLTRLALATGTSAEEATSPEFYAKAVQTANKTVQLSFSHKGDQIPFSVDDTLTLFSIVNTVASKNPEAFLTAVNTVMRSNGSNVTQAPQARGGGR